MIKSNNRTRLSARLIANGEPATTGGKWRCKVLRVIKARAGAQRQHGQGAEATGITRNGLEAEPPPP